MMSITKPEHSEANPQCQTGSRPVAEPETPAVHNNSGGWLSWVFGSGRAKEVHLPEDKDRSIVWDPTLHRWVNKTEPKAENKCVQPPPPMGTYGYQGNTGSVPKGVNPYSMKAACKGERDRKSASVFTFPGRYFSVRLKSDSSATQR
ncbi:protein transport protein Sec16A-like [Salvelinus fontinalis]|uniref:protein transport protein Sec16A-like n=1 Tax=Salvelinus fontinalis TaxID=8038 RepID=UPI002484ED65|nr:protein transport protein Sec16A-like [Salvelinus fontinalis]